MKMFTIDRDNNIAVYASAEELPKGPDVHSFSSEKELGKLLEFLSSDDLIQIWNSFAGVTPFDDLKPVKKFTDRKTAVARIWRAVQRLDAPVATQAATVATKTRQSRKKAKAAEKTPAAREGSKSAQVIELLRRPEGATLAEIMEATGWQAHSVRGFISGSLTKKMGLKVESTKDESGERRYRITK
jgi:hypothetical protein